MKKTRLDYLNKLAIVAFDIDKKTEIQETKTKKLQRMATLAREGKKKSEEFKLLDKEVMSDFYTVVDFGDEVFRLRNIVKRLKEYGESE